MTRDDFNQETKESLAKRVGMRCSNPNCRKLTSGPAVDPAKSVNVGVAAHIAAASPGGKRFDYTQTSEQRRSITNGIWLCQTCAKLIDSDAERFPAVLLHKWKSISEEAARYEVENKTMSEVIDIINRINIVSINQTGGQTAHTIINNKPLQRSISLDDRNTIIQALRRFPPGNYKIILPVNDPEADVLAKQIQGILMQAGWNETGFHYKILPGNFPLGVKLEYGQVATPSGENLGQILYSLKTLDIKGGIYQDLPRELVQIVVGPNPANYAG